MGKDIYLVIGGSGFLGRHIVEQLLARGDNVSVLDIVQRHHDVPFFSADITDEDQVSAAIKKCGATCIIHTASPHATLNNPPLFFKVNVEGTTAIIRAAVACKVRKLVYTSSAGVVFNGEDIIDVDERLPPPSIPLDAYNESKAQGEAAVIAANGKGGLLTVALRPAGIFGPGDQQVMKGFYQVYERNQTHFQIGDNTNLFDFTYVGNVAHAHLLAADKLDVPPPAAPLSALPKLPLGLEEVPPFNDEERKIITKTLAPIDKTTGKHKVPTCASRPLGPYVTRPANGDELEAAYNDPNAEPTPRPVPRSRFDQFSEVSVNRAKLHNPEQHPLQVAGQVFFITNGEPLYFWDFGRAIWSRLDKYFPGHRSPRGYIKLPKTIGLMAAQGSEWFSALLGKEPTFTKFKVSFSCASRWHNIEKARRILGYHPEVGLEEGIDRMVEWWWADYQVKQQQKSA